MCHPRGNWVDEIPCTAGEASTLDGAVGSYEAHLYVDDMPRGRQPSPAACSLAEDQDITRCHTSSCRNCRSEPAGKAELGWQWHRKVAIHISSACRQWSRCELGPRACKVALTFEGTCCHMLRSL